MGERETLGLSEEVLLKGKSARELKVQARIDTGATSSSLDESLAKQLDLGPVIRQKLVKSASGKTMRDMVEVEVEIKGKKIKGEFSIANREGMSFPALIGQNILKKGEFLVDPLRK